MNCLRPLITQPPSGLHRLGLHRRFRHVVGQPAVGGAARLGQAMRHQELRLGDQALEPFLLQMLRARTGAAAPTLSSSAPACRRALNRRARSPRRPARRSAPRCPFRVRRRHIPPARRSVRMPIFLGALPECCSGNRSSGTIDHSCCQFCLMKGSTMSSTKSRQLCRIMRCSSDKPRSYMCITPDCLSRRMSGCRLDVIFILTAGHFDR